MKRCHDLTTWIEFWPSHISIWDVFCVHHGNRSYCSESLMLLLTSKQLSRREAAHEVPSLASQRRPPIIEFVFWWIGINWKKSDSGKPVLVNINCQPIEALKWAWKLRRLRSGFGVRGRHWQTMLGIEDFLVRLSQSCEAEAEGASTEEEEPKPKKRLMGGVGPGWEWLNCFMPGIIWYCLASRFCTYETLPLTCLFLHDFSTHACNGRSFNWSTALQVCAHVHSSKHFYFLELLSPTVLWLVVWNMFYFP